MYKENYIYISYFILSIDNLIALFIIKTILESIIRIYEFTFTLSRGEEETLRISTESFFIINVNSLIHWAEETIIMIIIKREKMSTQWR